MIDATANSIAEKPTPKVVQWLANLVSYIFHPLFIPALVAWYLLYQHPLIKILVSSEMRFRLFAMTLINSILFPGLVVLLLWRLKFIPNVRLTHQRDRIIPLVVSILFYFWAYYVSRSLPEIPEAFRHWLLGVFLVSCAAMFTNIFFKISLHCLSMGAMVLYFGWMQATDPYWPFISFPIAILLAGITGSSRLALSAHQPGEVYGGYLAGAMCMAAAGYIV